MGHAIAGVRCVKLSASAAGVWLILAQLFTLPNLSTQRDVSATISIHASPDRVWSILTDFSAYPGWNPYIYPVKGEAKAGTQLELTLHGSTSPVTFQATVRTAEPPHELSWEGRVIGVAVFDRLQTFTIEEEGPEQVRLTARERFKGLLLPLEGGLPDDAKQGLEMMLHALRAEAEMLPASKVP